MTFVGVQLLELSVCGAMQGCQEKNKRHFDIGRYAVVVLLTMENDFRDSRGAQLTAQAVVNEIRRFMCVAPDWRYKIVIGSDSQLCGANLTDFVTAVVVHRVGNGGRYFWKRIAGQHSFSLRDRIIKEVMLSLETALEILAILRRHPDIRFDFEVHADVGENGRSSALIAEVTGMIRAYNFTFKTKPESYAASSVADKHV